MLRAGEVLDENYCGLCSEVPEAVVGVPVRTPLLRREWWYPMAIKDGLQ